MLAGSNENIYLSLAIIIHMDYNTIIPRRKEEADEERKNRTCNSGNSVGDCNNTADTSPKGLAERLLERVATPSGVLYHIGEQKWKKS